MAKALLSDTYKITMLAHIKIYNYYYKVLNLNLFMFCLTKELEEY